MNYERIKYEALKKRCRKCINQKYDLQLTRKDCRYWIYPGFCNCCDQVQNIVTEIAPFSRWKIWLAKKIEKPKDHINT